MHALANGLDLNEATVKIALGQVVHLKATQNDCCAVLELYPHRPGIFKGIHNENKLIGLASLHYYKTHRPLDEYTGKSSEGYAGCAIIMLYHTDPEQFNRDLHFIREEVGVLCD